MSLSEHNFAMVVAELASFFKEPSFLVSTSHFWSSGLLCYKVQAYFANWESYQVVFQLFNFLVPYSVLFQFCWANNQTQQDI